MFQNSCMLLHCKCVLLPILPFSFHEDEKPAIERGRKTGLWRGNQPGHKGTEVKTSGSFQKPRDRTVGTL